MLAELATTEISRLKSYALRINTRPALYNRYCSLANAVRIVANDAARTNTAHMIQFRPFGTKKLAIINELVTVNCAQLYSNTPVGRQRGSWVVFYGHESRPTNELIDAAVSRALARTIHVDP
jgi:hypothetical protein